MCGAAQNYPMKCLLFLPEVLNVSTFYQMFRVFTKWFDFLPKEGAGFRGIGGCCCHGPLRLGRPPQATIPTDAAPSSHPHGSRRPTEYDGFWALAYVESGRITLVSRKGNAYKSFPDLCIRMALGVTLKPAISRGHLKTGHIGERPPGQAVFFLLFPFVERLYMGTRPPRTGVPFPARRVTGRPGVAGNSLLVSCPLRSFSHSHARLQSAGSSWAYLFRQLGSFHRLACKSPPIPLPGCACRKPMSSACNCPQPANGPPAPATSLG